MQCIKGKKSPHSPLNNPKITPQSPQRVIYFIEENPIIKKVLPDNLIKK